MSATRERVDALVPVIEAASPGTPSLTCRTIAEALVNSPELADLVAGEIHLALERAAEAVRLSAYPPRIITGLDPATTDDELAALYATFKAGAPMIWGTPEPMTAANLEPYLTTIRDTLRAMGLDHPHTFAGECVAADGMECPPEVRP